MPPVKMQNKPKKKSTLQAKVSKHKKPKKKELTTPKIKKGKRDHNEKKKKKLESEVKKQKKKKIKSPSKPVKAAKERKKVVKKKNPKSPSKALAKKQKMKSPDLKGKTTINKRKRQNSESEVQVKMKKKRKISSPLNSSQITKPKQPVKMKKKMTQTETKDLSMKMDGMGTTKQNYVKCLSCNVLVPEKDFHSHLFFGRMKCRFCLNPVRKCTDFANQILKPNSYCSKSPMKIHGILQWDSCLHYVFLSMKSEITIRNFSSEIKVEPNELEICCEISKYIKSLESLEQVDPWKSAFQELKAYCEKVLRQLNMKLFTGNISLEASGALVAPEKKVFSQQSQGTECTTVSELQSSYVCGNITGTTDINSTESNEMKNIKQEEDLIKRRKHHRRLKKRDLKKIVTLPRDGRYLLVHYPNEQCPEECPECYSGFYPTNLTLYCTTGITKVVCEVCGLVIFIVADFYDARN